MRILQLHSDFIEYKPIMKEIPSAEHCEQKLIRIEEVIVLFVSVEEGDTREVAKQAILDVKTFLNKIKVNRILIYPYAHLSNNLAKPKDALAVVKDMETYAKESDLETYRAPFGWNKCLKISVKGHPLAEQSKVFTSKKKIESAKEEIISDALKSEEKEVSEWYIMDTEGRLTPVDEYNFSEKINLDKFSKYEISKLRTATEVSPHVILMKRLELAGNEPGSDSGNLRFYPKGRLIKSLLEQFVTNKIVEYGGMEVETPIMYDFDHPSLANYLNRFPARQYVIKSEDKDFFLRFSACFGQFLMSHDVQLSYKQLPFRIYELTRYSFRREKSGELTGLRRLRAFTMPDVHAMCADLNQALDEAVLRFKLAMSVLKEGLELGIQDYELAIRFTREFYKEHREFIVLLVKMFGRPVLVEMWPKKFFYFTLKWEFNFIDNLDKASALSTDQIDVENAERYDITYTDADGQRRHPIILHCSPSGAIERCMYALLEKAYSEQMMGKVPKLPLWLSPTQVRLIPISDQHTKHCETIASKIADCKIRVDIDERKKTVQKRVREAEQEWIPYIVLVGEKEIKSKTLPIRRRALNTVEEMDLDSLIAEIQNMVENKPFKPLSLPQKMTFRPIFT